MPMAVTTYALPKTYLPSRGIASFSLPSSRTIYGPQRKALSLSLKSIHDNFGICGNKLRVLYQRKLGFSLNAETGKGGGHGGVGNDEAEKVPRGESTMPERFRYLAKEVPDSPPRWPLFVALACLIYAWRAVLFELANWRKAVVGLVHFVGYIVKLVLALVFHFIGDPITSLIRCIETAFYTVRSYYSGIVAYAPVPELTMVLMMASVVLAIAEATVPNCVNQQPYLLTLSGVIGYVAVRGYISEPFFWTLVLGLYAYSRFVKRRDNVSSALPAAAVVAAIGEHWIRFMVITFYLVLAIYHHSRSPSEGKQESEYVVAGRKLPMPLVLVALIIGIRLAAKWAGYRHLTWMIV